MVTFRAPDGGTEMATSVDWRLNLASLFCTEPHFIANEAENKFSSRQVTFSSPRLCVNINSSVIVDNSAHGNRNLSATEKDKYSQCSWGRANKYSIDCWGSLCVTHYANVVVSPSPPPIVHTPIGALLRYMLLNTKHLDSWYSLFFCGRSTVD